jgi:ribosomal protein S18 acetylase RimI-like enzyme
MDVTIRAAVLGDLSEIVEVDSATMDGQPREAALRRAIATGACLVALEGDRAVGFAVFDVSFYGRGFVSFLVVHPAVRRRGVGTALMRHVESICPTNRLFTSTNASNDAMRRLLERLGYDPSGRIEHLDQDDPELVYSKGVTAAR